MARPRTFDEDETLDRVVDLFWSQGYQATSLQDLIATTGLPKGSLYNAFGDKRALFDKALDRYCRGVESKMRSLLESAPDAVVVDSWLDFLSRDLRTDAHPRGCMAMQTGAELGPHDEEIRARLAEHRKCLFELLKGATERAQAASALRSDLTPAEIAEALWTFAAGLQTQNRRGLTPGEIRRQTQSIACLIGAKRA
ncbi:MAG: TetR/AcrR family transcriptional regulator [Planctomycetota bacterium]